MNDRQPIRLGVILPTPGDTGPAPRLTEQARIAEAAGADSLWVDDHLVQVKGAASRYPFSADGRPTWPVTAPRWESLTALAFVAAATQRCTIGTAVLVLPQRHVVQLAKTAATLDVLSGGRLVLGCGVGWLAEEMEACGWEFSTRGTRADEMLAILRACWTGHPPPFDGRHVRLREGLVLEPTPVQRPGPPLLVGGMSRHALTRAAEHGDGWLALTPPELLDLEILADQLQTANALRQRGPRSAETFRCSLIYPQWPQTPGELLPALLDLAALGFDELIVEPDWLDEETCGRAIAEIRNTLDRGA